MPWVKDILGPEDIQSLVAYVRLLSPGYESYERFCGHGSDGYPPSESSDGIFGVFPFSRQELIGAVFDQDYFLTHSESALRAWVGRMYRADHSLMPRFGAELNGSDVRKILGISGGFPSIRTNAFRIVGMELRVGRRQDGPSERSRFMAIYDRAFELFVLAAAVLAYVIAKLLFLREKPRGPARR